MKNYEERVQESIQRLKITLGPVLHKKISRVRQTKALQHAIQSCPPPCEKSLISLPIMKQWPEAVARRLLRSCKLAYYERGTTLALNGEPLSTADILWVVSGKLTELPVKQELIKCAKNAMSTGSIHPSSMNIWASSLSSGGEKEPFTGPLVLPQLFQTDDTHKRIPLSVIQELILDRLESHAAGGFVASDGIILRKVRERAIRCVTPVMVYLIPLKAFNKELGFLSTAARQHTFDIAKEHVQRTLVQRDDKPSVELILQHNRLLTKVNIISLKQLWTQLQPFVFMPKDVLCPNVYVADHIYFLHTGKVKLVRKKKDEKVIDKKGAAVGLNAFVSYIMPKTLNENLVAVSETYTEVWGVSYNKLVKLLHDDRVSCVPSALKMLHYSPDGMHILGRLRGIAAFANMPELCLHRISHTMKLRVHGPGQCIIASNRVIREGMILLAGRAYVQVMDNAKEKREPIKCGEPYYFCEALTKKVIPISVFSDTSVISVHCSPACILDAMEENECTTQEIELVYDRAAKYIADTYGVVEPRIEAQLRAASRVREHNLKLRPPVQRPSNEAVLEAIKAERFQVENEMITCIVTRMQALHQDPLDLMRHRYLTDFEGAVATEVETETSRSPRLRGGGFTVDDHGEVIECPVEDTEEEEDEGEGEGGRQRGTSSVPQWLTSKGSRHVQDTDLLYSGAKNGALGSGVSGLPLPLPASPGPVRPPRGRWTGEEKQEKPVGGPGDHPLLYSASAPVGSDATEAGERKAEGTGRRRVGSQAITTTTSTTKPGGSSILVWKRDARTRAGDTKNQRETESMGENAGTRASASGATAPPGSPSVGGRRATQGNAGGGACTTPMKETEQEPSLEYVRGLPDTINSGMYSPPPRVCPYPPSPEPSELMKYYRANPRYVVESHYSPPQDAPKPISEVITHFDHRSEHQQVGANKYFTEDAHKTVEKSKILRPRELSVPVRQGAKSNKKPHLLAGIVGREREKGSAPVTTQHRPAPPRLAAIKDTISHLKDEAVGFDPKVELRRQFRKPPASPTPRHKPHTHPSAGDTMLQDYF